MFFSMQELHEHWGVKPSVILHVGAHKGEELRGYTSVGFRHLYWIEAQHHLAEMLRSSLDPKVNTVVEAAVWSEDGVALQFNIANNSESSSLYQFGTHEKTYPEVMYENSFTIVTKKLDSIFSDNIDIDFINLDIQGAELQALQGFAIGLTAVNWVYCEVNSRLVYDGCPVIEEIDAFLRNLGFTRRSVRWWKNDGWGDALYIRDSIELPNSLKSQFLRRAYQIKWNLERLVRILIRK